MTHSVKLRLVESTSPGEEPRVRRDDGAQDGPVSTRPRAAERSAMGELADERLVTLAAKGDMAAAETLYRRHCPFAFNLAARISGNTTDVEDVVHDAFLRAFDNLGTLRNPKAFRSWLGSIVVHAMRSRLRRGRLLRLFGLGRGGDPIDLDCVAADGASPRVRAELAQVYALLQTISADDRIAWTLRFVEGHDLKAAAELCGCSLATVKRRIRRAQRYIEEHFVGTQTAGDEPETEAPSESGRPGAQGKERAS